MSWIEKTQGNFIIQTGDGQQFNVLWKNARRHVEFNVTEFEFPELKGTLAKRRQVKGTRYAVEFYFVGENHLDEADAFKRSSEDPRNWQVTHPLYGALTVVPLSLEFDDTNHNQTKITGTLVETITDDRPRIVIDPVDNIRAEKETFDEITSNSFANNVTPETADINYMAQTNEILYGLGRKRLKITLDAEGYFNSFNTAYAAILNASAEPLAAAREIQTFINAPSLFGNNVQARLETLVEQFNYLRGAIPESIKQARKRIYELFAGGIVSALAQAAATPNEGDYQNRDQVFKAMGLVVDTYNAHINELDGMQTENGGELDSFIPDANGVIQLNRLINYTVANLFRIALDSKQERSLILETDVNLINVVHRLYGIDNADENLERMAAQNGFGLNDLFNLTKGRRIIYYV